MQELQMPCFGYEKKMIIVKNSGLFKKETKKKNTGTKEIRESLERYLKENIEDIKSRTILIFIEDSVEKLNITKTIESIGRNNMRVRTSKACPIRKKAYSNLQRI